MCYRNPSRMVLPHDVSTKKSCFQSASSSGGMEDKRANKNMMLSSSNTGEGGSACGAMMGGGPVSHAPKEPSRGVLEW